MRTSWLLLITKYPYWHTDYFHCTCIWPLLLIWSCQKIGKVRINSNSNVWKHIHKSKRKCKLWSWPYLCSASRELDKRSSRGETDRLFIPLHRLGSSLVSAPCLLTVLQFASEPFILPSVCDLVLTISMGGDGVWNNKCVASHKKDGRFFWYDSDFLEFFFLKSRCHTILLSVWQWLGTLGTF